MRLLRAGQRSARRLNCGVMRQITRVASSNSHVARSMPGGRCVVGVFTQHIAVTKPASVREVATMAKFEYKTVVLNFKVGLFKQGLPDIQASLNEHGAAGWQLKQVILPSSQWGSSDSVVAILEREIG